jgi:putative ABC transport system permease protein
VSSQTLRLKRDVAESLRSQPGRVGLSFLAVMIGIVVLTLLLSMMFGLRNQSRQLIRQFGANVAAIVPDASMVFSREQRGMDHVAEILREGLSPARISVMVRLGSRIEEWGQTEVWATEVGMIGLRGWSTTEGRAFDQADEDQASRVALITIALQKKFSLRVGDEFSFGQQPFRVIGVLQEGAGIPDAAGMRSGTSGEAMALVPRSTAARLGITPDPESAAFFIRMADNQSWPELIQRTETIMKDPALAGWSVRWITPETLLRGIRELQRLIALTAGSVALLCLILGGTTLMSLMLADVRQRIQEIGLRRALGATRQDVALLFVVESCVITGAAAVGGIIVAAVLLGTLSGRIAIPLSLQSFTFVIPVIASIVLGCIFSFWPARVAAGLSPAQALRNA